jgi:hypothetical protein
MSISYKKLWEVQLREYPQSIRLTPWQMIQWANSFKRVDERELRFHQIASTIQLSKGLFYITRPEKGDVGCRYGLQGHQYMSGFGMTQFSLVDGRLVEISYS